MAYVRRISSKLFYNLHFTTMLLVITVHILSVSFYRCFHPHITNEEAEQQLRAFGTHGSFLCQRSEHDPNTYTLSLLYVTQQWVLYCI